MVYLSRFYYSFHDFLMCMFQFFILLLIYVSLILSSAIKRRKKLRLIIVSPFNVTFIVALYLPLLSIIILVFWILISNSSSEQALFTCSTWARNCCLPPACKTVLSTYVTLSIILPLIFSPAYSPTCLQVPSVYKSLKRLDKTHRCRAPNIISTCDE